MMINKMMILILAFMMFPFLIETKGRNEKQSISSISSFIAPRKAVSHMSSMPYSAFPVLKSHKLITPSKC